MLAALSARRDRRCLGSAAKGEVGLCNCVAEVAECEAMLESMKPKLLSVGRSYWV